MGYMRTEKKYISIIIMCSILFVVSATLFVKFIDAFYQRAISYVATSSLKYVSESTLQSVNSISTNIRGCECDVKSVAFICGKYDDLHNNKLISDLLNIRSGYNGMNIAIVDVKGLGTVVSTGKEINIHDYSFNANEVNGDSRIGYLNKSLTGESSPVILVKEPIYSENGEFMGEVYGTYDLDRLIHVSNNSVYNDNKIILLNGDGIVLYTDHGEFPANIGENLNIQEGTAKLLANKDRTFEFEYDGDLYAGCCRPLEISDWCVMEIMPYTVLKSSYSDLNNTFKLYMSICFIVLSVVSILVIILSIIGMNSERKAEESESAVRKAQIVQNKLQHEASLRNQALEGVGRYFIGIYIVNLNNGITTVIKASKYFDEMLSSTQQHFFAAFGNYLGEKVPDEYTKSLMAFMSSRLLKAELDNGNIPELTYRTSEGQWITVRVYRALDYTTEKLMTLWVFENANERARMQETLKAALSVAEQASCAKSQFLSNMSHDIRTLMNTIVGMTRIAKRTIQYNPERKECAAAVNGCLENISVSSNLMLGLINNILDMSRIENGKLNLEEDSFTLDKILDSISVVIGQQANEKAQKFSISVNNVRHNQLIGDKSRLNEVFMNILGNCVKFTPEGGVIHMDVNELGQEGEYARFRFTCSDTGQGISKEFLPHIFESFVQENQRVRSTFKGTGLGMAIAKSILDAMNGTIDIQSEVGKGTVFTVEIPIRMQNVPGNEADNKDSESDTIKNEMQEKIIELQEKENAFNGLRVLLVEDIEINAEIVTIEMEERGASVDWAVDGKQALERFKNSALGCYRLVLMDIRMPVMDGFETAKAIRALDRTDAQNVMIIAVTADAYASDIEKAKRAGMNEHISKPIDFDVLEEKIRKLL